MFKRFTAGVAVGYVLGARAGQKRYEQISALAEKALDVPWVGRLVDEGRDRATDQGRRVLATLKERSGWDQGGEARGNEEDSNDEEDLDDEEDLEDDEDDDRGDEEDLDDESDYDEDSSGEQGASDAESAGGEEDLEDEDEDEDGSEDSGHRRQRSERSQGRSRHRIGDLASAARERGRVS